VTTPRVVSLVPSATETLRALGVEPIGVTRFCDVDGPAVVGGTKSPDVRAIVALAPDLVVVNDEENRAEDADALRDAGLVLHSMSPRAVVDVGSAVGALAAAVDVPVPAPFGSREWDAWLASNATSRWCTAFVAIWRRPWMSLARDTYGASLLELLGVDNVYANSGNRYPTVTLDDVATRAPELVLLPSEPYVFGARHAAEIEAAVAAARVLLVDGRDLFWWGVRTPAALDRLRAAISR
jgi:ABC-type Fe3+-hydroxamate transport system substrate-binding protein